MPTRSQIENWQTAHLDTAAEQWQAAAARATQIFADHVASLQSPGGTVWEGKAADSAYDVARDAQDTVGAQCSIVEDCSTSARRGAEDIRGAQRAALNAISEAEDKGYQVGEDLSVTDTRKVPVYSAEFSQRKIEAQELSQYIRWRAADLPQTETRVAAELHAKAAELTGRHIKTNGGVQAVDFKRSPDSPVPKPHDPAHDPGRTIPADHMPGSLSDTLDRVGHPAPAKPAAVPLDPNTPAGKAQLDTLRNYLRSKGMTPDQIDAGMKSLQTPGKPAQPSLYGGRQPGKETYYDAFHDSWDQGVKGTRDMFGANGPEAMEKSWEDTGKGLLHAVTHPLDQPKQDLHDLINNPEGFLGHKSAIAAQTLPGLMFGGEGAAVRAGLPADVIREGGAPTSLVHGWNPTGGLTGKEFESQFGTPESRLWPGNDGFPEGHTPQPAQLPAGTIIDRFGSEGGRYLAPDGAPFADRALAPESIGGDYNRYMLTGKPLPPGLQILEGPVQPWYGQTPAPGATQYMIVGPEGANVSVKALVDGGVLDLYGPLLGR